MDIPKISIKNISEIKFRSHGEMSLTGITNSTLIHDIYTLGAVRKYIISSQLLLSVENQGYYFSVSIMVSLTILIEAIMLIKVSSVRIKIAITISFDPLSSVRSTLT